VNNGRENLKSWQERSSNILVNIKLVRELCRIAVQASENSDGVLQVHQLLSKRL
jgi:hypothetical protein